MPTATIKFVPHNDGEFDYVLSHSTPSVDRIVKARNQIVYAHGDTIVFTTDSGNFSVQWERAEGGISLKSPFKNEKSNLGPTTLQSAPYKTSELVDTGLSKEIREALRAAQGFVARYRYSITVTTPQGTFTDNRLGTYDC